MNDGAGNPEDLGPHLVIKLAVFGLLTLWNVERLGKDQ
jgi:hypothetical protein